jgi:hypothetical protein
MAKKHPRTRPTSRSGKDDLVKRHPRLLTDESGIALIAVLLLTAVMLALGAFGARSAQIELRIAQNEWLAKRALDTAEAGLNHAFSLIQVDGDGTYDNELSAGGTGGVLASLGSVTTLDGQPYRFASFGNGANDGYYVQALDDFDEAAGANDPTRDRDNKITLVSRGRVSTAERIIAAQVDASMFQDALFGKRFVSLTGGSRIDSFDSRVGTYDPGTARSNGDTRSNGPVTLSGSGTAIYGDAVAGTTVSGGTVSGTTADKAPPLYFSPVSPCGPAYYPDTTGMTGSGNWSYTPANGNLKVAGGGSVTLANGTYCFSSISLTGGGIVKIDGPVKVYLTEASDLSGGVILNTTSLAANFFLYSSCTDNNGLKLSGGSGTYMAIYAPDTDVVFTGGSDFYGAVVGGSIKNSGGTNIHYDEALHDVRGPTARLSNWHELRTE